MKNKQLREKKRGIKRSTLTGRIVNGRDVILCEEASMYLKKLGYKIISPQIIASVWVLLTIFISLGFISIIKGSLL